MSGWLRSVVALLAGVLAAGAAVAIVEAFGHQWLQGQSQFLAASLGLGVAAFAGGCVASWIRNVAILPVVIATVLACLMLVNVFSFSHPVWFVPVSLISLGIGTAVVWRMFNTEGAKS